MFKKIGTKLKNYNLRRYMYYTIYINSYKEGTQLNNFNYKLQNSDICMHYYYKLHL